MNKRTKTTIELNGQSYNALSGQLVGGARPKNIDGVVKQPVQKNHTNQRTTKPPLSQPAKKPEPAKTLMRTAVKKPSKTSLINKNSSPLTLAKTNTIIQSPAMYGSVDHKLVRRAKSYKLNDKISRFGATVKQAPVSSTHMNTASTQKLQVVNITKPDGK